MILMKNSESSRTEPNTEKSRISALEMLRTDIYSNAGSYSNIYQLAEKMNLSPSYLQAIYKKKFGISCYEDILSAKIRTGQYYLSTTDMTVYVSILLSHIQLDAAYFFIQYYLHKLRNMCRSLNGRYTSAADVRHNGVIRFGHILPRVIRHVRRHTLRRQQTRALTYKHAGQLCPKQLGHGTHCVYAAVAHKKRRARRETVRLKRQRYRRKYIGDIRPDAGRA